MITFEQYICEKEEKSSALDKLQTVLDVVGVEPTVGTVADVSNILISTLRAFAEKEPDKKKKHLINGAISLVSVIPGADLVKLLKARKLRKLAVPVVRSAKKTAGIYKKTGNRFG